MVQYSPDELEFFEQQSTRNVVLFYRDELTQISRGIKAFDIMTKYNARNLRRLGLLKRGNPNILSDLAERLLEELESS